MTTFTQKKDTPTRKNQAIFTFFEAKICIYQKKAVPLRSILKTDI